MSSPTGYAICAKPAGFSPAAGHKKSPYGVAAIRRSVIGGMYVRVCAFYWKMPSPKKSLSWPRRTRTMTTGTTKRMQMV